MRQIRFKLLTRNKTCLLIPSCDPKMGLSLLFITLPQIKKNDLARKIPIVQAPCFVKDLCGHSASLRRWDKSLQTRPQLFVAKGKISKRSSPLGCRQVMEGFSSGESCRTLSVDEVLPQPYVPMLHQAVTPWLITEASSTPTCLHSLSAVRRYKVTWYVWAPRVQWREDFTLIQPLVCDCVFPVSTWQCFWARKWKAFWTK